MDVKSYEDWNKELTRLRKLIENDCDEEGVCILNDFPHRVILSPPIGQRRTYKFLDWLDENIKPNAYKRIWVDHFYFKNIEDAVAFKILWCY